MKRVLFVCVENANRSQMAEAFARMHGEGVVEAFSAGSRPAEGVNPRAVAAMAERGYDLGSHRTKPLSDVPPGPYDFVVTMGCGDACPFVAATNREDWALPDPREMGPEAFAGVRDEIERRVTELIEHMARDERMEGAPGWE